MSKVTLVNVTESAICISDHTKMYAMIEPQRKMSNVDEALLTQEAFAEPIQAGWLKVLKQTGAVIPAAKKNGAAKRKVVDGPVSAINRPEVEMDTQAVSYIKPGETNDSVTVPEAVNDEEEETEVEAEDVGQVVTKRGRGRPPKLAPVIKAKAKTKTRTAAQPAYGPTNGEEEGADDRGFVIHGDHNTMPGQAGLSPAGGDAISQLNALAEREKEVFDEVGRNSLLLTYTHMIDSKKATFIADIDDVRLLTMMYQTEKSAKLALVLKKKIKNLGGESE
jgi:hypothetical protein